MRAAARPAARLATTALLAAAAGCARPVPPSPDEVARARAAHTYSAELQVSLRGSALRGRTGALVGFERPDRLRIEIPGPGGVRLVAVTAGGSLTAVFPGEQAYFQAPATAEELEALLGVSLAPSELMDLLVGVASPRLRGYQARWTAGTPRRIQATLPDGARLRVTVREPELDPPLPDAAFAAPPHAAYRRIDADEARSLWDPRRR